jgi:DNA (cytosine-5)-methyltransferase 1
MAHKHKLNTFHLFAGAGGGILADILLGHNPIGACEIEPYPRDVLLARQRDGILPNFPIWDDIREFDGTPWKGTVDVLCGGWPCQDLSIAGKGAGIEGARSGLWSEYLRLILEIRPRIVFMENSPMLVQRGGGRVVGDLARNGYDVRWVCMGGSDYGNCSDGKRFYGVAYEANGQRWDAAEVQTPIPYSQKSWRRKFERAISKGASEDEHARTLGNPNELARRVERCKAIGNGQDAVLAAMAFNILSEGLI